MVVGKLSRGALVKRGALAGATVAAGGTFAAGLTTDAGSAPSDAQDERIFAFLLGLEQLQSALYDDAIQQGALSGEVAEYAKTVQEHEQRHVAFFRKALGAKAAKAGTYAFGAATSSNARFLQTATRLEDIGLAAYNGAAGQVTRGALRGTLGILSVEARHASWARDLARMAPAPRAADRSRTEQQVQALVKRTGFQKTP